MISHPQHKNANACILWLQFPNITVLIERRYERGYLPVRDWMDMSQTLILFTVPLWLTRTTCSSLSPPSAHPKLYIFRNSPDNFYVYN